MTRIRFGLAVLAVLGVLLLIAPAQASIIPVTLQFSTPGWTGTASFDDTTGQPWSSQPTFTAYEITDMAISDGLHTWTEDELGPLSVPPPGGLLVDPSGRFAFFATAIDSSTGTQLDGVFTAFPDPVLIADTFLLVNSDLDNAVPYIASVAAVSIPNTLLLVASGVAGLGAVRAWRRR